MHNFFCVHGHTFYVGKYKQWSDRVDAYIPFKRNCSNTILHSHQQIMKVSVATNSCYPLVVLVFSILVILLSDKLFLIVVLKLYDPYCTEYCFTYLLPFGYILLYKVSMILPFLNFVCLIT